MANNNVWDPYDPLRNVSTEELYRKMQAQAGKPYREPTKQERITALSEQIFRLTKELEKLTLDDPLTGPTNRQLQKHESLRNAWDEYLVVRKLVLGE